MENKRNLAITSVLVALIALMTMILGLSYVIVTEPVQGASVENLMGPFNTYDSYDDYVDYEIYNVDDSDSDSDEDDTDAPGSISDLTATDITENSIRWEWTNPSDSDFYQVWIYLNGAYLTRTSNEYYNVEGLNEDTTYTITIHTQDDEGNINDYDVSDTQTTLSGGTPSNPNAPVISDFPNPIVFLEDGSYTFDLDDYVTDLDHTLDQLTWSVSDTEYITVVIDALTHEVTFTAPANWNGAEWISFLVEDPDSNYDAVATQVDVQAVDDPTTWLSLLPVTIDEDTETPTVIYNNIQSRIVDADGPQVITIEPNPHFTLEIQGNDLVLTSLQPNWYNTHIGGETVTLTANGHQAQFQLNINQLFDDCLPGVGMTYSNPICD